MAKELDFDTDVAQELAEELREKLDECADLIRDLYRMDSEGAGRLKAYCLADFEGRDAGWLGGNFARDLVQEYIEELDDRINKTGDWAEDEEECAD